MGGTAEALRELDAGLAQLGGCGDGGCIVLRPIGMHTNGGCRCNTNGRKMLSFAYLHNKFAKAIRAAAAAEAGP